MIDPVIAALISRLPEPDTEWSLVDRLLWMNAMGSALNLVYGSGDNIPKAKPTVRLDGMLKEENIPEISSPTLPALRPTQERKSSSRPDGIPSNLAMTLEAIDASDLKRASANEIIRYCRNKYWEEMPESWKGCLWNMASEGKLGRDGTNFCRTESIRKPQAYAGAEPEQRKIAVPAKPKALPTPKPYRAANTVRFTHNEQSIELPARGYVMASKLQAVMGKHVSEAFMAEKVLGSNSEGNRAHVRDTCMGMNDTLSEIGLRIDYYAGYGLVMKETGVA